MINRRMLAAMIGLAAVAVIGAATVAVIRTRQDSSRFAVAPRTERLTRAMDRGILLVRNDQLILVDPETKKEYEVRKAAEPGAYYNYPRWSPDGKQIAYAITVQFTGAQNQDWGADVAVSAADGSGERIVLKREKAGFGVEGIAWSADGSALYIGVVDTEIRDGRFLGQTIALERLDLATGARTKVAEDALHPAVSRDGSRIAFVTFPLGLESGGLWVARPDGSEARKIVSAPGTLAAVAWPRFSPDDGRIGFVAVAAGPGGQIVPDPLRPRARQAAARRRPWQPPVAAAHGPPFNLWSVPAEGGTPQQLTSFAKEDLSFAWGPGGADMAILAVDGLYLMPLENGSPQRIGQGALEARIDWR